MWEIKNTPSVQERTRTYSVSHSKKLRLDPDLFRPLFHMFLYLLVCPEARKRHISKFESSEKLPITLDEKLPIAYVRRALDHCLRFMNGYRLGLTGAVLEYAVKKYKSRRRLSPSINLTTIQEEYFKKKNHKWLISAPWKGNLSAYKNLIFLLKSVKIFLFLADSKIVWKYLKNT